MTQFKINLKTFLTAASVALGSAADGDVVVPLDAEAFGFWLKAAFGDPTTTGTGPWTHAFQSGAWTLPGFSIETGMPEVPRYAMYSGCVLDQLSCQMQRSGLLTATARRVAQGETVGRTTSVGTPAALELKRFGHSNGSISQNGADPSNAALTGSIEVRFSDQTLVTQAINGDLCELELGCVQGISTRSVDDLVKAMGMTGVPKN